VLRYGKICPDAFFDHYEVASDLADRFPASFLESFGGFLARDVGQPAHR
jgi:hypothetical protein